MEVNEPVNNDQEGSEEEEVNNDQDDAEQESGYEMSEDEVVVDGNAVEGGLLGKGKQILSDDEVVDGDSDYDGEETMKRRRDSSSSEEEETKMNSKGTRYRKKKLPEFPEFREQDANINQDSFKLGMLFPNGKAFKEAMKEYSIRCGKQIWFKKNDKNRIRAECKDEKCKWTCFASLFDSSDTFMIKTYRPQHTCGRSNENRYEFIYFPCFYTYDHIIFFLLILYNFLV